jgi:hypothetical protein
VERWLGHGFQFVTSTSDADLVLGGGQAIVEHLKRLA